MNEPRDPALAVPVDGAAQAPAGPDTAGRLLRRARQAQGVHIAVLASAIKVVPRKLELLEADQFDQLPDATFTRALAQAVCRSLKIDAAPVLALLPPLNRHRLEQAAEGLNTPFRERPGRVVSRDRDRDWAGVASPVLWIAALLIVLSVAVYVVPSQWLPFSLGGPARTRPAEVSSNTADPGTTIVTVPAPELTPAASEPSAALPGPADARTAPASAPPPLAATAPADAQPSTAPEAATAAAASGLLQVHVTAASWVGVTDAHGRSLIARLVQPGESVGLDGTLPMKVRIGNAAGTRLVFKGQPFDIAAYTRDNVARLDLK